MRSIPISTTKKIRYAVVGQGWFAQTAILPAFANATENSQLAALVSGDPVKRKELSETYKVPTYSYEDYDSLLASGAVDAVYIATPNSEHREHTVRAAQAGVHVLCEKPMADTVEACEVMRDTCAAHKVKLMIAYRLHFEEANLRTIELLKSGVLGEIRLFSSVFTQQVAEGNIRLDPKLGGSPLHDIGVYCINAARYLFQDDPTEVYATDASTGETRFQDVPEMVSAILRFPKERLATFTCGFGEGKVSEYRVVGTRGDVRLDPAYAFEADLIQYVTVDGSTTETRFRKRDQVGAEIITFSNCIVRNQEPEASGVEGIADVRIVEALHESMHRGKPIALTPFESKRRPTLEQAVKCPPVRQPELVNALPPSVD